MKKQSLCSSPILALLLLAFLHLPFTNHAQRSQIDQSSKAIFNKGKSLLQNQKYNAARQQFEKYRQVGESELLKSEALFYEAKCAMELYQKPTVHLFNQYVEEYPEMAKVPKAYFNLGKYSFRKKDFPETGEWLGKTNSEKLNPAMTNEYHFMAGYALYKQEQYDSAQKHFANIMKEPNAYYNMGNYYYGYIAYQKGHYSKAINRFKQIEGDEKFGPIVPVYITQFYLLQEKPDSTIAYGEAKLDQEKVGKKGEIQSYVGEAYYQEKNYKKVIDYLRPLDSGDFQLTSKQHVKLGFAYYQEEQFQNAISHLQKTSINKDSTGQFLAYHLGDAYLETGQKEQARNFFDFAAKLDFDKVIKRQALFNYAQLSYDLGYQKEAISQLRKFTNKYPNSSETEEAQALLGDILLTTKNYQNALAIIEQVPEKSDKIMGAYQKITYQRGLELFEDNNFKDARDIFIKSLQHKHDNRYEALAYLWLGECYFKNQEFEKAGREYKNFLYQDAAESTPYHHLAQYNLGYCHFKTEAYDKAVTRFNNFINHSTTQKNDNRYLDAVSRLGDCYFALKQYNDALAQYEKVIQAGEQDVDYALYQKGIIQGLQGKPEDKIASLQQLSQNHPQSPYIDDALYEIGNVYFLQSNYRLATQQFKYLIQDYEKSSYYRAAKLKLGLIQYNKKSDDKAIATFKSIVEDHPHSNEAKEAINQLQTIYIDQGRADSLISFLENVPNANLTGSFKDSATYESAFSHIKNNDCKSAIPAFEDYLESFPKGYFFLKAHYYLANCARKEGKTSKALTHYQAVIDIGSNQYMEEALTEAATIHYNRGHCTEALPLFKQLQNNASERTTNLKAFLGQMRCHFKEGNYESTIRFANQLINLSFTNQEHHTEARYYLGKSHLALGQKAQAFPHLKKVHDQNGGEKGAEAKYLVAKIQFDQGQFKESQNSIYELRENYTNYDYWVAKGFILLADVFVQFDDLFQASHTLQSIINNYEGKELKQQAQQKLDEIQKMKEAKQKDSAQDRSMEPDTLNQLNNE